MVKINGTEITTVRGDTTEFNISLRDATGYKFSDSEYTIRFSVKASYSDTSYIISPTTASNDKITISASTMATIQPGRYVYDIEATKNSIVSTVQRGKFIVLPDVTI